MLRLLQLWPHWDINYSYDRNKQLQLQLQDRQHQNTSYGRTAAAAAAAATAEVRLIHLLQWPACGDLVDEGPIFPQQGKGDGLVLRVFLSAAQQQ